MKNCELCGEEFAQRPVIKGERRNFQRRRYCLKCSPLNAHNTKRLHAPLPKKPVIYKCRCGADKPEQFYKHSRHTRQCRKCKNMENIGRGQRTREKARKLLGGRCMACGFDKWLEALDFHHLDSESKDRNWKTMRSWSWDRVLRELKLGILLCRNCHGAHHAGIDIFADRCAEALSMRLSSKSGRGAVRQRSRFGNERSGVRIPSPRPSFETSGLGAVR